MWHIHKLCIPAFRGLIGEVKTHSSVKLWLKGRCPSGWWVRWTHNLKVERFKSTHKTSWGCLLFHLEFHSLNIRTPHSVKHTLEGTMMTTVMIITPTSHFLLGAPDVFVGLFGWMWCNLDLVNGTYKTYAQCGNVKGRVVSSWHKQHTKNFSLSNTRIGYSNHT